MKTRNKSKFGQPLAVIATSIATLGLTTWFCAVPASADTATPATSTVTTNLSNSPYAVLGTVSTQPALLTLNPNNSLVGHQVSWSASGLPANTSLRLVWETYTGQWQTQAEHFIGAQYTPGNTTLLQVTTDANGNVSGTFRAPSGFGDTHMVGLVDSAGDVVAAGTLILSPVATIVGSSVAEGLFFHIHVDGVGVGGYTSVYEVLYDNRLLGNVSAVTTSGQADFTVRAEGGVGSHTIQLVVGGVEGPYLNAAQSPFKYRPNYSFTVNVTPGQPTTVSDALPQAKPSPGNHLTASISSGIVGDKFTLSGESLTPNHPYQIVWNTMAGSRVSGSGYNTEQIQLGTVTTDASGNFSKSLTVPDDLGGPAHTIQLLDGATVAGDTSFRIYPSLISAPKTVTVGQQFTVNLHGVGWTEYDNTYAVNYDNSTIGYVCGFNSHGDVTIQLQATGAPGLHYVDLYPSVYKGQQTLPYLFGIPLLTYAKDHPGDDLPAIHVVVNVVPESSERSLNLNASTTLKMPSISDAGLTEVPLYNIMTGLKQLGVKSTWNGHTWAIMDGKAAHATTVTGTGPLTVTLNGKKLLSAPSTVATEPGGTTKTTFIPQTTVDKVLTTLGITSYSWGSK